MAFDGSGNFNRIHNWVQDAANAIDISASEMDGEDNGFAAGLSNCVTRDGQGKMGADFLPAVTATYNLGSGARTWAGLTVNTITAGPPVAGTAITGTGVANAYAGVFNGSSAAGQSFGLAVRAGTNASDITLQVNNQANSLNYAIIAGDGGMYLGAPTGTTQGKGTLNVDTGLLINGVNLYPGSPINTQNANYAVQPTDSGKTIYKSGGVAHANSLSATLPIGFTCDFVVLHGAASINIVNNDSAGGTQFYWSPTGATATTRVLAADGVCTVKKVAAATWYISGTGIT